MSKEVQAAIIAGVAVVVAAIVGYMAAIKPVQVSIEATRTAEARLTLVAQTIAPPATSPASLTATLSEPTGPTETSTPASEPLPTDTPTAAPVGKILFEEDFEDGKAQFLGVYEGNWKIVQGDTGNRVFEIDNINSSRYPGFNYGSLEWDDYIGEYRVRVLDFQRDAENPNIVFSFRSNHVNEDYIQAFKLADSKLVMGYNLFPSPGWLISERTYFHIEPGLWYSVRVEVMGTHARVFVDELLLAEFTDSRLQTGGLALQAGPGVHAQFDDIRVIAFEE